VRRRRGPGGKPAPPRRGAPLVVPLLAGALLAGAGCSPDTPEGQSGQPSRPVALDVETVYGLDGLDEATRTELETEVGDVISRYVVRAFLGDYPRENFVAAVDSFTGGAAGHAVEDIDVLTAARYAEATRVDAIRLDARLSFLVDGDDVVGASAGVRFGFTASPGARQARVFRLRGRFLLVERAGAWSIFGYDVSRDDGAGARTGASS
jgi:hypothetical protein